MCLDWNIMVQNIIQVNSYKKTKITNTIISNMGFIQTENYLVFNF